MCQVIHFHISKTKKYEKVYIVAGLSDPTPSPPFPCHPPLHPQCHSFIKPLPFLQIHISIYECILSPISSFEKFETFKGFERIV